MSIRDGPATVLIHRKRNRLLYTLQIRRKEGTVLPTFEQIKRFYSLGLWTEAMVRKALAKGLLTQEQYDEITGREEG